jgi:CheY-like chemotaxis protein
VEVALVNNGLEALDYLSARNEFNSQLPNLIVLDINMPFLDGRETFERIKRQQRLRNVPIIVFSSSEKPADKQLFNSLGIEYFVKPTSLSYMTQIVNHMIEICR